MLRQIFSLFTFSYSVLPHFHLFIYFFSTVFHSGTVLFNRFLQAAIISENGPISSSYFIYCGELSSAERRKVYSAGRQTWSSKEQGNLPWLFFSLSFFWLCPLESADCLCVMKLSDWHEPLLRELPGAEKPLAYMFWLVWSIACLLLAVWPSFHMGSVTVSVTYSTELILFSLSLSLCLGCWLG